MLVRMPSWTSSRIASRSGARLTRICSEIRSSLSFWPGSSCPVRIARRSSATISARRVVSAIGLKSTFAIRPLPRKPRARQADCRQSNKGSISDSWGPLTFLRLRPSGRAAVEADPFLGAEHHAGLLVVGEHRDHPLAFAFHGGDAMRGVLAAKDVERAGLHAQDLGFW